jgi:hypoxanthine phosphoribosyltransferase
VTDARRTLSRVSVQAPTQAGAAAAVAADGSGAAIPAGGAHGQDGQDGSGAATRAGGAHGRVGEDGRVGEVLVSADDLQRRVRELGEQISRDYAGRPLLLVGVLKGAVFFLSDLMRYIEIPVEVDFMAVASYGSATDSSGVVRILKDLDAAIEDRDVLIVEDIVDSGLTLQYLLRNLGSRNPRTLEVCALLTKPERSKVQLQARYVGFEIADRFVVGYGLDYAERHRNLPFVAVLER